MGTQAGRPTANGSTLAPIARTARFGRCLSMVGRQFQYREFMVAQRWSHLTASSFSTPGIMVFGEFQEAAARKLRWSIPSMLKEEDGWRSTRGVYFISKPDEKGVSYIRFKDAASGSVRTIAPIQHPVWYGFTVSPDQRSFLSSQADNLGSDLMLVENFR